MASIKKQKIEGGESADSSNSKISSSEKHSPTNSENNKLSNEEAYDDSSSDSDTMPEVLYGEGGECDEDVDSCDDLTEEQNLIYEKWCRKTGGFSVPRFVANVSNGCLITPIPQNELVMDEEDTFLSRCVQAAIDNNHKEMGQTLKLVRTIKCNESFSGAFMNLYITFEAEDESRGQKQTYQTYVEVHAGRGSRCDVKIFREKKQRRRHVNSRK